MRFLFVVQGEGRGHFTQALVLSEMLRDCGDQVVGVLVGKCRGRRLPDFFLQKIGAPVSTFESPDFLPSPQNRQPSLVKSVMANVCKWPVFYRSIKMIRRKITELQPDIVINFYELLTGFTYLLMPPGVPQVCIGHQYLFLHPGFEFPRHISRLQLALLRLFSRLTSIGAVRRLALSFYPEENDEDGKITVVPPLIRREIKECSVRQGNYLLGYMLNSGYVKEVEYWSRQHQGVPLHFFWDRTGIADTYALSADLILHQINDVTFIRYMGGCKAYLTTAGFESVCEALYLGKPVLMVPVHVEQECNAWDAQKVGAGVRADHFDPDRLLDFIPNYHPAIAFRQWVDQAEFKIYAELKAIYHPSPVYRVYNRLYHMCFWGFES